MASVDFLGIKVGLSTPTITFHHAKHGVHTTGQTIRRVLSSQKREVPHASGLCCPYILKLSAQAQNLGKRPG